MNALKRYSRTLFCAVGFLAAALVAGCGGGGDQGRDPILGLPAADLVSVAVTPATAAEIMENSESLDMAASLPMVVLPTPGASQSDTRAPCRW